MYSLTDDAALPAPGFPIRRSAGQRLFSASPRLIAAVHVLLRLLVPRHPPCALLILTVRQPEHGKSSGRYYPFWLCAVFKVRRGARRRTSAVRSLKTEQRRGRYTRERPVSAVDVGIAP